MTLLNQLQPILASLRKKNASKFEKNQRKDDEVYNQRFLAKNKTTLNEYLKNSRKKASSETSSEILLLNVYLKYHLREDLILSLPLIDPVKYGLKQRRHLPIRNGMNCL